MELDDKFHPVIAWLMPKDEFRLPYTMYERPGSLPLLMDFVCNWGPALGEPEGTLAMSGHSPRVSVCSPGFLLVTPDQGIRAGWRNN